ncbi:MAG: ABC transporter substrate-binding protein [Oscillospiraceae bacterium]
MKKVLGLTLAAVIALSMAACGGAAASTAQSDSVVIGGLAPLTGAVSQYGIAANNGALLAVKDANEAGGVLGKNIEYVYEDEKGDATEALNAYNKLVQNDKIIALVGDVTTKPTLAVAQKAAEDGLPMITPTATGAEVTQKGDNIFRACFIDPYQGELMAHYAFEKLGATTAAILYDTGDDYSDGVAKAFEATAKELGITVTATEGYASGSSDFNAQLTKIKEGNPDVIMAPCYYEDAAKIIVQARNLGIESTFLGPDGWDGVLDQIDASNASALNNSYYCSQYPMKDPTPELQAFIDKYKAEYGEEPNMFAALGYEAMQLMLASIEKAGTTDSAAIVEAMKGIQYQGIVGSISFANGNDPVREAYIIEFEDGAEVVQGAYGF